MNHAPPSKWLMAAELPRALFGAIELVAARRRLKRAPRGDGRPVIILPGLANADWANAALRRYLNDLGYRATGWGFGHNRGARTIGADGARLDRLIAERHRDTGEQVTLIGISLGGLQARLMAHRRPDLVREVITISSPFAGDPRATNVWRAFQWLTGERIDDPAVLANRALVAAPPSVPTTAIWSASDGLVSGAICRRDDTNCIEVRSSHLWVQMRAAVLMAVAETLASSRAHR